MPLSTAHVVVYCCREAQAAVLAAARSAGCGQLRSCPARLWAAPTMSTWSVVARPPDPIARSSERRRPALQRACHHILPHMPRISPSISLPHSPLGYSFSPHISPFRSPSPPRPNTTTLTRHDTSKDEALLNLCKKTDRPDMKKVASLCAKTSADGVASQIFEFVRTVLGRTTVTRLTDLQGPGDQFVYIYSMHTLLSSSHCEHVVCQHPLRFHSPFSSDPSPTLPQRMRMGLRT